MHLHGQEEQLDHEEADKVQKLKQMNAKIKTFQQEVDPEGNIMQNMGDNVEATETFKARKKKNQNIVPTYNAADGSGGLNGSGEVSEAGGTSEKFDMQR